VFLFVLIKGRYSPPACYLTSCWHLSSLLGLYFWAMLISVILSCCPWANHPALLVETNYSAFANRTCQRVIPNNRWLDLSLFSIVSAISFLKQVLASLQYLIPLNLWGSARKKYAPIRELEQGRIPIWLRTLKTRNECEKNLSVPGTRSPLLIFWMKAMSTLLRFIRHIWHH